jgi:F-type H+-transporting ATPase subunit a
MAGPLEQFEVKTLFPLEFVGQDVSFTNASLWMVLSVVFVCVLLLGSLRRQERDDSLVPSAWQSLGESLYETVSGMVQETAGRDGRLFFPFIFTLFMFILAANLLGMIPGGFSVTSHLAVNFSLALLIFVGVTVVGFARHGLKYFGLFMPHGAPLWTAVILIPIELISYCTRPFSLALRLFANMTVGHVLLKVFAGFVVPLGLFGIVPVGVLVALNALELMVAVIQAYVFSILTCVYLSEALHMH